METRTAREEHATCTKCHAGLFSVIDRLERFDPDARSYVRTAHVYRLVCENCGQETEPFLVLRRGDSEGTVTGTLGESIQMDTDNPEHAPKLVPAGELRPGCDCKTCREIRVKGGLR
jgi:hypothetical protein